MNYLFRLKIYIMLYYYYLKFKIIEMKLKYNVRKIFYFHNKMKKKYSNLF